MRDLFQDLEDNEEPIVERANLARMVTVVDSVDFFEKFSSKDSMENRPDLGQFMGSSGEVGYRAVVDLLVEQVECAERRPACARGRETCRCAAAVQSVKRACDALCAPVRRM